MLVDVKGELYTLRKTFRSVYDEYRDHDQKSFDLIRETERTSDYEETGPTFEIRLETGEHIFAWPEEIPDNIMAGD